MLPIGLFTAGRLLLVHAVDFLQQMMKALEAQGRTNVRQEAREIFEGQMEKDWAAGRTPLGLQKRVDGSMHSISSAAPECPHAYGMKALLITGRKYVG